MSYKKAWKEYKETIQQSAYMQRLSLEHDEKVFREGFEYGIKYANSLKCSRLEVIDHTPNGGGRAYIKREDMEVEIQQQDNEKTLKIFLCGKQ